MDRDKVMAMLKKHNIKCTICGNAKQAIHAQEILLEERIRARTGVLVAAVTCDNCKHVTLFDVADLQ